VTEELDALFFDAGGTLIDMCPPNYLTIHEVLARMGLRHSVEKVKHAVYKAERVFDNDVATLQGTDEETFWLKYDTFVLRELGFEGDVQPVVRELSKTFDDTYSDPKNWSEYPDTRPMLEDLGKRDFFLGMISNATPLLRRVMDHLDLTRYFDEIVVSSEVGVRKPAREIFWIAARNAKVQPNRCLYVGDRLAVDVVGARKAGMNAILLDRLRIFRDADCVKINDLASLRRFL